MHSSNSSNGPKWDPDAVLGLIHPMRGVHRCTGWAPSMGRRCMNSVAAFRQANAIFARLARRNISEVKRSKDLEDAVALTLCYLHKAQEPNVLAQWRSRLTKAEENESEALDESESETLNESDSDSEDDSDDDSDNDSESDPDSDPDSGPNKSATAQVRSILKDKYGKVPPKRTSLSKLLALLREQITKEQRENRARRKEAAQDKKERKFKEEQKRQEDLRQSAEQLRRAQEAREKRARAAQEERERKAKEKEAEEACAWARAWKTYSEAWEVIEADKAGKRVSKPNIPWPVKSGRASDVDAANIRLFFRKTPPRNLNNNGEKWFKFINREILRWHTDQITHRFGPDVTKGDYAEALNTVVRVLIQLRDEARKERQSPSV